MGHGVIITANLCIPTMLHLQTFWCQGSRPAARLDTQHKSHNNKSYFPVEASSLVSLLYSGLGNHLLSRWSIDIHHMCCNMASHSLTRAGTSLDAYRGPLNNSHVVASSCSWLFLNCSADPAYRSCFAIFCKQLSSALYMAAAIWQVTHSV